MPVLISRPLSLHEDPKLPQHLPEDLVHLTCRAMHMHTPAQSEVANGMNNGPELNACVDRAEAFALQTTGRPRSSCD